MSNNVSDSVWEDICRSCNPDIRFRDDLEKVIETWKEVASKFNDPEQYPCIRADIEKILRLSEELNFLLVSIKDHTRNILVDELNNEEILKSADMGDISTYDEMRVYSYYYDHIRKRALPLLIAMAKDGIRRSPSKRTGMTKKRQMEVRRRAIFYIDRFCYESGGGYLTRGDKGSAYWVLHIMRSIDSYITHSQVENLIAELPKGRKSWAKNTEPMIKNQSKRWKPITTEAIMFMASLDPIQR